MGGVFAMVSRMATWIPKVFGLIGHVKQMLTQGNSMIQAKQDDLNTQ